MDKKPQIKYKAHFEKKNHIPQRELLCLPGIVVHLCNPSTGETEAGGWV
jgi:hypothetical protein